MSAKTKKKWKRGILELTFTPDDGVDLQARHSRPAGVQSLGSLSWGPRSVSFDFDRRLVKQLELERGSVAAALRQAAGSIEEVAMRRKRKRTKPRRRLG